MQSQSTSTIKGSFSHCTARFNGECDPIVVEEFIATISVHKDVEYIDDSDAIKGFPLLLEEGAVSWWEGVQSKAKTWNDVITLLRAAYAPTKPAYQIYMDFYEDKQKPHESTDEFITKKRAILAKLPEPKPDETMMIDMIYGLLSHRIRDGIPRESFTTIQCLLAKARTVETSASASIQDEDSQLQPKPETRKRKRCNYCRHTGHITSECRRKERDELNKNIQTPAPTESNIHCYKCKAPGFVRSTCPTCKDLSKGPPKVFFNCITPTIGIDLPIISIASHAKARIACIDTTVRTSVAGRELFELLLRNGTKFRTVNTDVMFANGKAHSQELWMAETKIIIGGRLCPIKLTAMPKANDNRTLFGIDFLEENGIVLDLGQRLWYFADQVETKFDFVDTSHPKIENNNQKRLVSDVLL